MSKETILVIEDERDLLEVIQFNLEKDGYRVLTATNGEKGLELARSKRQFGQQRFERFLRNEILLGPHDPGMVRA